MGNCACVPQDAKTQSNRAPSQATNGSGAQNSTPIPAKPDELPQGFEARFRAIKLLGRGAEADTWLYADRKRDQPIAMKLFRRPVPQSLVSSILQEIRLQSLLGPGHMNLINVYEVLLTDDHLGIAMECAKGGPLTAFVSERWASPQPNGLVLSEAEARFLFRQFIDAVAYCHRHSIAHRDLKLDNTLLDDQKPPVLKLCDFGFAKSFRGGLERATSRLGTAEYMSPELLHEDDSPGKKAALAYDPRATDVWAAGVMVVVMLLGAFPFDHARQHEGAVDDEALDLWLQEVNKDWSESPFVAKKVGALSPEARDLLDRIFVVDPAKRISVPQILEHPWYKKPLAPEFQAAADKLAKQQAELDAHMRYRKLDQARINERDSALDAILREATAPPPSRASGTGLAGGRAHVRPLQAVDASAPKVRRVDLTEAALAARDNPPPCENPAVAEHTGMST
ncbi:hypothetical protein WJX81_004049 [Elliptochloris bilobata]|uniref:Protein kinase domain-containing protein n=1 Tax=Elliptochloris bilobata TaxID=381761 RepID=A0AAW1RLW7_9CHLO